MHTTTVTIRGVTLDVEFDYQPEERETLEYPGCDEEIEIISVRVGGTREKSLPGTRYMKDQIDIGGLLGDDVFGEIEEALRAGMSA